MAEQSTSLLELCEKEEWENICRLMPKMIHIWNFEEKNAQGNSALIICCHKGSLNLLHQLYIAKCKRFDYVNVNRQEGATDSTCAKQKENQKVE